MTRGARTQPAHVPRPRDRGLELILSGLGLTLRAALVRAMVTHAPMPFWDVDPRASPIPIADGPETGWLIPDVLGASLTGLGPSGSLLLDLIALLGAALVLLGVRARRGAIPLWPVALALLGSLVALGHGLLPEPGSLEAIRRGAMWTAAIWAGLATWLACGADARARRLATGLLLGFSVMLIAKGAVQLMIEHPATLESFRASKERQLTSRGWEPGSASARLYERRLSQAEASGWFGLANVYATFMAGMCVAALGIGIARIARARRVGVGSAALLLAGTGCGAMLVGSGSKAGIGAAAIGIGLGAMGLVRAHLGTRRGWPPARARLGSIAALGAIAIPLLAIGVRGLIGTRIGELSLLFRSHYLRGAARVIADNPVLGVGPSGFQNAYLRARPALSPEEVDSPHSVLADWLAALGLGGLAWGALLVAMLWIGGRALMAGARDQGAPDQPEGPEPAMRLKTRLYWLGGVAGVASVVALYIERGASLPLLIAGGISAADPVPMGALALGMVVTLAIIGVWVALAGTISGEHAGGWTRLGLAAGGVTLAVHAQLDMAPVRAGSAALFMVVLGALLAAAGPDSTPAGEASGSDHRSARARKKRFLPSRVRWVGPIVPLGLGVWVAASGLGPTLRWEAGVVEAARAAAPVGRIASSLSELEGQRLTHAARRQRLEPIVRELAELTGRPRARDAEALREQVARARREVIEPAVEALEGALAGSGLSHVPTSQRIVRLSLEAGRESEASPGQRERWLDRAHDAARAMIEADPAEPSGWSSLARVARARGELLGEPGALEGASEALERLIELNPYGLGPVRRRMELAASRGREAAAARWARRLLELDELKRLDPLRRLTDSERRRAAALADVP